jgi:arylsulfatase A-like enzyme
MKTLDETGLAENTVVIFFSDNGGVKGITDNSPLRGGKGMLYEGGIRVPLVIRWPGRIKPATVCEEPVIGTDFFPTMLKMAGVTGNYEKSSDGRNIMPLLKGEFSFKREAVYWHFPAYLEASRYGKGARDPLFRTRPAGAVRKGEWKLIEFFEDGALELYNLKDDIGETENLTGKYPAKVKELHALMQTWRKQVNAPVPVELNPEFKGSK